MTVANNAQADRSTMQDVLRGMSNGQLLPVVETLTKASTLLADIPMHASNNPMGERVVMRSSLPTTHRVRINQGVPKSKSSRKVIVDTIAMFEARSEVDLRQKIPMGGEAAFAKFRMQEDDAFIEALSQNITTSMLYGDERSDETNMTGLLTRIAAAANAQFVDAGGSGTDNCSILIVDWKEGYVSGIYPEAVPTAGIQVDDRGKQQVLDVESNPFDAMVTSYTACAGVTVGDTRHFSRIGNIDISDLLTAGAAFTTAPDFVLKFLDALGKMQPKNGATRMAYMPQDVLTALEKQALRATGMHLRPGEWAGEEVLKFRDVILRRCDSMLTNEARVV